VRIAAAENKKEEVIKQGDIKITLEYGEFSPFLKLVNKYLG